MSGSRAERARSSRPQILSPETYYCFVETAAAGSGLIEYSFRNTRFVLGRFTLISRRRFFRSGSGFFE